MKLSAALDTSSSKTVVCVARHQTGLETTERVRFANRESTRCASISNWTAQKLGKPVDVRGFSAISTDCLAFAFKVEPSL
jgi:hypothetical protein